MDKSIRNNKISIGTIIIGTLSVGALLYIIFKPPKQEKTNYKRKKKRVFVSFAKEDEQYRDYLVQQSKEKSSPFEFIDMSVKQPWPEPIWKDKCRAKIKNCDGVIILLSGKTWSSKGARWEAKCAKEENIPVVGMHIFKNNQKSLPPELSKSETITWTWQRLEKVISKF